MKIKDEQGYSKNPRAEKHVHGIRLELCTLPDELCEDCVPKLRGNHG